MDPANISPWLERLDDAVDHLEEATQPLTDNMADTASKLPLLDKAKIYVLVTYSVESVLFSALRLNEVDAKEHPIFKELARVRQYFEKIQNIEFPTSKPAQSLNKEAAIRFIRSDLADNKEINTKLTEMIAKERAKAALKTSKSSKSSKSGEKRKLDEAALQDRSSEKTELKHASLVGESDEAAELEAEPQSTRKKTKKEKREKSGRKRKERNDKTTRERSKNSSED
ncbi:Sas10/Utp3/C1D family-domain-containing protein [Nemania serpens]|nr:Sas10/Utp3/C1D family-domain-containing protein [Nemania serpens]